MTIITTLTEKIYERHARSSGYLYRLHGINTSVLASGQELVTTYAASIGSITALVEAAMRIGQRMRSNLTVRWVSSIFPPLKVGEPEVGKVFASSLEPFKASFFWKVVSPYNTLTRKLIGLRKQARMPFKRSYERAAAHPHLPSVIPPPTFEAVAAVSDHARGISEAKAYGIVPSVKVRMSEIGTLQRDTQRMRVSAVSQILQPAYEKLAETYKTRVFEPVSKVHKAALRTAGALEVYRVSATTTTSMWAPHAMEVTKVAGEHVRTVSDTGGDEVAAYTRRVPSVPSSVVAAPRERARKLAEVYRVSATTASMRAPHAMDVTKVAGEHIRTVSDTMGEEVASYMHRVPTVPSSVVEAPRKSARVLAEAYRMSPTTASMRAPHAMDVTKVAGEHIRSVSDTMGEEVASYTPRVPAVTPPVAEAYRMSAKTTSMLAPHIMTVTKAAGEHVRSASDTMGEGMAAYTGRVSVAAPMDEAPGVSYLPYLYPSAKLNEAAVVPLFSAVSQVGMRFPAEILKSYLEPKSSTLPQKRVTLSAPILMEPGGSVVSMQEGGYTGEYEGLVYAHPHEYMVPKKKLMGALTTILKGATTPIFKAGQVHGARSFMMDVEQIIKGVEGKISEGLAQATMERYAVERVPVGPMGYPTLRLQEVVPLLQAIQTSSKTRAPPPQSPFHINITTESLRDESDLRELEWKITRILKNQARRYGLL
jgi:hypothetical protein